MRSFYEEWRALEDDNSSVGTDEFAEIDFNSSVGTDELEFDTVICDNGKASLIY